jgi:hypothetical protein
LAILLSDGRYSGYFYNTNEDWTPDTGRRVMQGKRLIHFPDQEWKRWILHGDPETLHWEFDDTARENEKKRNLSEIDSSLQSYSPTDDKSLLRRGSSRAYSSKASTPYPTLPTKSNATGLLSEIISHFRKVFNDSPETFEKCAGPLIRILEKSDTNPINVVQPGNAKEDGLLPDRHITMVLLYNDLIKNQDEGSLQIQDSFRVSGNKSTAELVTCMSSDSKGIHGSRSPVILGAHNIPAHPLGTKGIKILPPNHLQSSGVCSPVPNGFTDDTAVMTSPGFITEPHWDFFGIPQFVIHGGGTKLWLIWPPTPANLTKASESFFSVEKSIDFTITKALEELSGLEIRLCTQEDDWFILAPCAIHAVVTVKSSGHKNKLFVDYGSFDEWDRAYSLISNSLKAEYDKVYESSRKTAIIEEILESRKAFRHWESLLKQKVDHPSASKTRTRLNEIKKEVEVRLKSLGYVQGSSRKRRSSPSPETGQNRTKKRVKGVQK